MPKLKSRLPSYRFHKASGQAVVTIAGRDHYLGQHGVPESYSRYRQIVAQWAATSTEPATQKCQLEAQGNDLRLNELFVSYLEFAGRYYVKNGRPTGEVANLKDAIRPVVGLFAGTRVADFGPRQLKQVRDRMIQDGLSRKVINARVTRRGARPSTRRGFVP